MEFINLKSSPIPILFIPFNQSDKKCSICKNEYSRTLTFKQKYCIECLLRYIVDITDNGTYLDIHISTINSQCDEHEMSRNRERSIQEWCKNCSIISFFKQIPTNSLAHYDDTFSSEIQSKIMESEKDCKRCGKLIYPTSLLNEKLKICSDCYQVSYDKIISSTTNEIISILYLPWWDSFYICQICHAELLFDDTSQKWCPHCFVIYSGCRYCLTTNVIFGHTDQSQCRRCKRKRSITINDISINIRNSEIDKFLYNARNTFNIDNFMRDYISKYDNNPLNLYNSLKEKVYVNFDPEAIIEWIPRSRIKGLKEIEKGGFGLIYRAKWLYGGLNGKRYSSCHRKKNGETIAIKRFLNSQDYNKHLLNELKSYQKCYIKSGHILRYYGVTKDLETKEYMLVMKYADGKNLRNYLQNNFNDVTWKRKTEILLQISNGLKSIHDANFVHRDIHSRNILLIESYQESETGRWLIGDLGLSQPANNTLPNSICGIIPYVAPDIFKGAKGASLKASKTSDIYSIGMIMWELTSGRTPFANIEYNYDLIKKIIEGQRPEITDDTPECFANLIKSCWKYNPAERPTINEICETLSLWYDERECVDQFIQAEKKRLELTQSKTGSVLVDKSFKFLISKSLTSSKNFSKLLESGLKEIETNSFRTPSECTSKTVSLKFDDVSGHFLDEEPNNEEHEFEISHPKIYTSKSLNIIFDERCFKESNNEECISREHRYNEQPQSKATCTSVSLKVIFDKRCIKSNNEEYEFDVNEQFNSKAIGPLKIIFDKRCVKELNYEDNDIQSKIKNSSNTRRPRRKYKKLKRASDRIDKAKDKRIKKRITG